MPREGGSWAMEQGSRIYWTPQYDHTMFSSGVICIDKLTVAQIHSQVRINLLTGKD